MKSKKSANKYKIEKDKVEFEDMELKNMKKSNIFLSLFQLEIQRKVHWRKCFLGFGNFLKIKKFSDFIKSRWKYSDFENRVIAKYNHYNSNPELPLTCTEIKSCFSNMMQMDDNHSTSPRSKSGKAIASFSLMLEDTKPLILILTSGLEYESTTMKRHKQRLEEFKGNNSDCLICNTAVYKESLSKQNLEKYLKITEKDKDFCFLIYSKDGKDVKIIANGQVIDIVTRKNDPEGNGDLIYFDNDDLEKEKTLVDMMLLDPFRSIFNWFYGLISLCFSLLSCCYCGVYRLIRFLFMIYLNYCLCLRYFRN